MIYLKKINLNPRLKTAKFSCDERMIANLAIDQLNFIMHKFSQEFFIMARSFPRCFQGDTNLMLQIIFDSLLDLHLFYANS